MRSFPRSVPSPRRGALAVAALAAAACVVPAIAQAASDPETKRLAPTANAGYFLGFPSPTYRWHGCTGTASAATLAALQNPIPGARPNTKGTKQSAVTFTTTVGAPYLAWRVKPGWTICGVQATARLRNSTVDSDLIAEVGYISSATSGLTAANGTETVQVPIPKKSIDRGEFERYEGKVFAIAEIRDVTVFVRRTGS
jgi:hypothetical protein